MNLEPYAVIQGWHLPEAGNSWEVMLGEYLQKIATRCISTDRCVIGHIKALATFSDRSFLRVSVVDARFPATTEGNAPRGCTELELTLNVLVYGLKRMEIERITREVAEETAALWGGSVRKIDRIQSGSHIHNLTDERSRL